MELRNRTTGVVITADELRRLNPNTSFPPVLTPDIIDSFGYDPVLEGPVPTVDSPYQYAVRNGVVEVEGTWFTAYNVGPIFPEYTDDEGVVHTTEEQYADYCAVKDAEQAKAIRSDRNKRLSDCDWTQLSDAPVDKAAWAAYRQELRDISGQTGFPWEINWPSQPGEG